MTLLRKYFNTLLLICLISCSHAKNVSPSKISPIEISFKVSKKTMEVAHYNVTHSEYASIYDYLSLRKKQPTKGELCFYLIHDFQKGLVLLPQRKKLLELSEKFRTKKTKSVYPKNNLMIQVHIKKPDMRLTEDGRLFDIDSIKIEAVDFKYSDSISCSALTETSLYNSMLALHKLYQQ